MYAITIILALLLILLLWVLLAPVVIGIDTRIPGATLTWGTAAALRLWYDEEKWMLFIRVMFFKKKIELGGSKPVPAKKKKTPEKKKSSKKIDIKTVVQKSLHVLKSFRVVEWGAALDTGDCVRTAWLYPLNYIIPGGHCKVNFNGDTWLVLKVKNNVLRVLWAWLAN